MDWERERERERDSYLKPPFPLSPLFLSRAEIILIRGWTQRKIIHQIFKEIKNNIILWELNLGRMKGMLLKSISIWWKLVVESSTHSWQATEPEEGGGGDRKNTKNYQSRKKPSSSSVREKISSLPPSLPSFSSFAESISTRWKWIGR